MNTVSHLWHHTRLTLAALFALACACTWASTPALRTATQSQSATSSVLVFAAASLKEALDEQVAQFHATGAYRVRVSYAGSNALARQIEAGAPAALFISADETWMDYVASKGVIAEGTRRALLGNELVLIAPASGNTTALDLANTERAKQAISAALGNGRFAIADPRTVPAGKYAQAALTSLGLWGSVSTRLASADNVRSALAFVARAEAPLGAVYRTDALAEQGVRVVARFPAHSHPPIVYPAAILRSHDSAAARALLDFLGSAGAQATWRKYGFTTK